jgi:hypothetical protein
MDVNTLNASLDFARGRLLGTLDAIEKSGQPVQKVLAWRPGAGRAHIGWQAMHCAATHDRYLNVGLLQKSPKDEKLVKDFGGGSTPSDELVPDLASIRQRLQENLGALKSYVAGLSAADLDRKITGRDGKERSVGESLILLAWHEAHHQGQIHLTWNMYKAANGVK